MPKNNYEPLIASRLFVGGVNAIDEVVTHEDIDVIYDLRATQSDQMPHEKSIYKPIYAEDEQSIQNAVDAVMKDYHDGKNVYFHCNTGRGRGGTIAAAVLLELDQAKTVEEAEQQVKTIRSSTNISPAFKDALRKKYEK